MTPMRLLDLSEIARMEEHRQALGLSEVADAFERIAGGIVGRGAPGAWINNAVGLGFDGPVTRADVDRLAAYHQAAGTEPRVEVCPFADPSLAAHLGDAGFRVAPHGGFESVFFRELHPGVIEPPVPTPPEVRIELVDPADDAACRAYALVAVGGFMPDGMAPREEDLAISIRCMRHPRTRAAAAYIGDRCVGAGAMEVAGPVAGLFGLSVDPEFRRRGIQQALMAYRLNLAAAAGAKVATIGTRPGVATERNARRMGFQMAYTKVVLTRPAAGLAPVLG